MRPTPGLEIIFAVKEALKKCGMPGTSITMAGNLPGNLHKIFAVGGWKSVIGPIGSVVIPLHWVRPIFVQRQIETIHRHTVARKVCKSGSVKEWTEVPVPG